MFKIIVFGNKTLSWWYSKRKKIDMNPPYQRRGRLWSDTDKAYLIDSIINGYDIPKLYIADFTWGNSELNLKKLPYAIIDGKQRFEAIFDFFNLFLKHSFTSKCTLPSSKKEYPKLSSLILDFKNAA